MSNLKIDREYLTTTLTNLIRINSINPTLVSGGAGEAEIAAYVADTLRGLGMEVAVHEVEPRRVSVVGRLKGSGHGKTLMLNGHMDTVGIDNMREPFSAEIVDGKMYGRGAYDMKCGLAACIADHLAEVVEPLEGVFDNSAYTSSATDSKGVKAQ